MVIHRWAYIGGHTWVGRIEPVFIFMPQASVGCDNRGFPWLVTIGVFRGLRRGGASVRCDEVLPCVATQRQNRWERHGVSQVSIQPSISSTTIPSFRHHHRLSQSSSSAIIAFRHHCVSPSLCFAVIKFHHHQVSPSSSRFVKFTWNLKGHSRHLQGISRVQVEPNCVHLDPYLELTT